MAGCYLVFRTELKESVGTLGGLGRYQMPGELINAYPMTTFINRKMGLSDGNFAWLVCVDRECASDDPFAILRIGRDCETGHPSGDCHKPVALHRRSSNLGQASF